MNTKIVDPFHPPASCLEDFCRASNAIEGEIERGIGILAPTDIGATRKVIALAGSQKPITEKIILDLHMSLCSHLKGDNGMRVKWAGKYRDCNVFVGKYAPPNHGLVKPLMENFIVDWRTMDSWEAHNRFEHIHPFQDRNGRMGRLIWLWKALQEGYKWNLSMLHLYYYQTLSHTRK